MLIAPDEAQQELPSEEEKSAEKAKEDADDDGMPPLPEEQTKPAQDDGDQ